MPLVQDRYFAGALDKVRLLRGLLDLRDRERALSPVGGAGTRWGRRGS